MDSGRMVRPRSRKSALSDLLPRTHQSNLNFNATLEIFPQALWEFVGHANRASVSGQVIFSSLRCLGSH